MILSSLVFIEIYSQTSNPVETFGTYSRISIMSINRSFKSVFIIPGIHLQTSRCIDRPLASPLAQVNCLFRTEHIYRRCWLTGWYYRLECSLIRNSAFVATTDIVIIRTLNFIFIGLEFLEEVSIGLSNKLV